MRNKSVCLKNNTKEKPQKNDKRKDRPCVRESGQEKSILLLHTREDGYKQRNKNKVKRKITSVGGDVERLEPQASLWEYEAEQPPWGYLVVPQRVKYRTTL